MGMSLEFTDDEKTLLLSNTKCTYSSCEDEEDKKKPDSFSNRYFVVLCILLCELCERLTYYGIVGNLVLYLTIELDYSSAAASSISLVFTGFVYTTPLFGGLISDSFLGKLKTIFCSLFIYGIGTIILPIISIDYEKLNGGGLSLSEQRILYLLALSLVAIGTGGIKTTVSPFGVQQLEDLGDGVIQTYFNWYYWFINIGSIIAYTIVVYIQQEISFAWGYTIPAASIIFAGLALLAGRKKYITTPPEGSILSRMFNILGQAISSSSCKPDEENSSFLDRAKEENGGTFRSKHVEEVKLMARIIPVLFGTMLYWTVYVQMQTSFVLQGERMNLVYGDFTFPVASLSVFNKISLLLLIPLMDTVVYPLCDYLGFKLTQLKRMGFGMFLGAIAMIVAAGVEVSRKNIMDNGGYTDQIIVNASYNASTMTVFAQIPQYFIFGASEILTSITGMEFAYSQAPKVLQGVLLGLFLFTAGLGSYLGSLLVIIVNAATKGSYLVDK
ncbi:solute carrier family 15 member 4-like [Antedon mediterranea]|uniref:solute carrier family 15 member 4-like n=1 Tax=Antedon mediterranea TaxID=105859 RepID=UPI003AF9421C